jgi:ribosomal protein L11 methyltransferase
MAWRSLRLELVPHAAEALSEALLETGAQSVSLDAPEHGRVALRALFADDADPAGRLAEALERCELSLDASPTIEAVDERDWVRASQAQFSPLRIGRLWIGASWHPAPEGALIVRIDPGLAFGTGSHVTTRLTLRFAEQVMRGGEEVLDYGCGSGILAIAAAKLGARHVDAVDIDPIAVEVTRQNARANGVRLNARLPEEQPPYRYDVLMANILAQPLIELAPLLAALAKPRAALALAGLLESQADEVARAYAPQFDLRTEATEEGWALLSGRRR